jgi:4-alpha-glucanotransferase
MLAERASGILLHPSSLPGAHGAGDLGEDARRFVDWLADAGQGYWQMLPLVPTGLGDSPYMSPSAFAGNPLLIDLVELAELGWLDAADLRDAPGPTADGRVDFVRQRAWRMPRLRQAARAFAKSAAGAARAEFEAFCSTHAAWLDDYALFMALDVAHPGLEWCDWPELLARRDAAALRAATRAHADEITFWKFCQWCFERQWSRLKAYANARGVRVIGDAPIFVAYHSADVWARQDLFELDADGRQTVVAGVPPDYFSATGQRWGNPLYRWPAHAADGYAWWRARLRRAMGLSDLVRIDHFRGFAAHWEIHAEADSAVDGRWVPGPGAALFEALHQAFPELPIIAEDLGVITPDVESLRDDFGLPGMRVLQFAFGDDAGNAYLPHHYGANCVAYTGTHDNDTSLGWWASLPPRARAFAQHYLGTDGGAIHWSMMRALSMSGARLVIYPMQDVLGLDGTQRMNVPGVASGNWGWRFDWRQVEPWHARVLREMGAVHGRAAFAGVALPD